MFAFGWGVDCDEVYPNLFIGDEASARNIRFLQRMGITHVLNCAEGVWTDCSFVDLTADYYEGTGIRYQGLQLWDSTKVKMTPYFGCANEFIRLSLKETAKGKCLVHCQMGVSRSCVAAMVYMMMTEGWDAVDIMKEFRRRRDVRPNDHFLSQLVELDNELRKERLFQVPRQTRLHSLAEIDKLPKPWHYEFWEPDVEIDTLPFKLSHIDEPREDMERPKNKETAVHDRYRSESHPLGEERVPPVKQKNVRTYEAAPAPPPPPPETSIMEQILLKAKSSPTFSGAGGANLQVPEEKRLSTASSETEWEYYTDEEEEEGEKDVAAAISHPIQVNSAKDWKDICAKVESGEIEAVMDTHDEVDKEQIAVSSNQQDAPPNFEPTTERHLNIICWRTKPWKDKKPSRLFSSQFAIAWKVDCDEVYPNLFIGDQDAAKSIKFLKHLRITHVLNTAEGKEENLVDLTEDHYLGSDITYKGFLMWDSTWFDVSPFIGDSVDFISAAMNSGGRILVNCQMGVSRSCTCAMAYMMVAKGWTAIEALKQFRSNRDVRPNDGFMKYLVDLDNRLRLERGDYAIRK